MHLKDTDIVLSLTTEWDRTNKIIKSSETNCTSKSQLHTKETMSIQKYLGWLTRFQWWPVATPGHSSGYAPAVKRVPPLFVPDVQGWWEK